MVGDMILNISDLRDMRPTGDQNEIQGLPGRLYSCYDPTGARFEAWWNVEHGVPLRFRRQDPNGAVETWEPRVHRCAGHVTSDAWRGLPPLPRICGDLAATG